MLKKCSFVSLLLALFIILTFSYCSDEFSIGYSISSLFGTTNKLKIEDDLLGRVEIPKIGVAENIYHFDSDKNQVDQHVSILDGSILPNQNNSSIIFLAAHSGRGNVAYFKDLDQLEIGDLIYFYYQDVQYTYQITKIFEEEKDGDIELSKSSEQQLVLTTCSPAHEDKQLIVDTMLIQKKEN